MHPFIRIINVYVSPDETLTTLTDDGIEELTDMIQAARIGLARAKAEGKMLGRPAALSADQQAEVKENIKNGEAISAIASGKLGAVHFGVLSSASCLPVSAQALLSGSVKYEKRRA